MSTRARAEARDYDATSILPRTKQKSIARAVWTLDAVQRLRKARVKAARTEQVIAKFCFFV